MKPSELKRYLGRKGVKIVKIIHGTRHDEWVAEDGSFARVPRHQGKEINIDTLNDILADFDVKDK